MLTLGKIIHLFKFVLKLLHFHHMPKPSTWNCPTRSPLLRKAAPRTFFACTGPLITQRTFGMCSRRGQPKFCQQSREVFWEIFCQRKVIVVSQLIDLLFFLLKNSHRVAFMCSINCARHQEFNGEGRHDHCPHAA